MNPAAPDIKAIFADALEVPPGPARAAYLDAACGPDRALRRRLDDLLAAHERAGDVLGPAGASITNDATGSPRDPTEPQPTAAFGSRPAAAILELTEPEPTAAPDVANGDGLTRGAAVRYLGDYEIRRELGRGGMGVVYEARQISLNRRVALKMVRAGLLAGDAELNRFRNEAEAVALLDHPGIVPIYEVGQHQGQHFFSMKLVPGGSLVPRLKHYPEDPKAAARLVAEAAEAVAHAHARGILHRDLKPANILVDADGHPYLTDFGLAKRLADDSDLTQTGAVLGTPSYMAPEQAAGRRAAVTTATDVYGLGAVLYALLTGKAPFAGDSVVDTLAKVKAEPPVPPRKLNPAVPPDLATICLKCLEKDPRRRYASAQALADDLHAWLGRRPIAARPAGALERALLFVRRKPLLATTCALAATVVFLAAVGGTIARLWRAAERARAEAIVARDEADHARERLAVVEYGRTIQVAHQEWREANAPATLALLDRTREDLRGWEWNYLHRLCHTERLVLKGRHTGVRSAAFSPDGRRVVTAGSEQTVIVWDAATGAALLTLANPDGGTSAAFSPDGTRLVVTTGFGRVVRIHDAATGAGRLALRGHDDSIVRAAFSPDGSRVVSAGRDGTARVWDAATGAELLCIRSGSAAVVDASFSPDGRRVLTVDADRRVQVRGAATGAVVLALDGAARPTSAAFSPDGRRIVTTNLDRTARIWDAANGAALLTLRGHGGYLATVAFSPDGTRLVTGGDDATARVWDAATGAELRALKGHAGTVMQACFSPDGSRVLTAGGDGTARVWDAASDAEFLPLERHGDRLWMAAFSPDGTRVVAAGADGIARVWDAATGALRLTIVTPAEEAPSAASLDLPLMRARDRFQVNMLRATLRGHTGPYWSAAFSPDGTRLATGSPDGPARIWDAATGAERLVLRGHAGAAWVAFSPDGTRVVTAGLDRTARVWDAATGVALLALNLPGSSTPAGPGLLPLNGIGSATFSPDGRWILAGFLGRTAQTWDAATGAPRRTIYPGLGALNAAAFSLDGSRVVFTSAGTSTVQIQDAATDGGLLELKGHTAGVNSAAFSPDGSRVLTASFDRTARIWDAATGAELLALKGQTGFSCAAFSPDGSRIVTTNFDGTARIWDARPFAPAPRPTPPPRLRRPDPAPGDAAAERSAPAP